MTENITPGVEHYRTKMKESREKRTQEAKESLLRDIVTVLDDASSSGRIERSVSVFVSKDCPVEYVKEVQKQLSSEGFYTGTDHRPSSVDGCTLLEIFLF